MINVRQLRQLVVQPVLRRLEQGGWRLGTKAAEELLLGTAVYESTISGETYLRQVPSGPALGIYQMEPATFSWLQGVLLQRSTPPFPDVRRVVEDLKVKHAGHAALAGPAELVYNLALATAYARLRYWVVPDALPAYDDAMALAEYWGAHYQTRSIESSMRHWAKMYNQHVRPSR